jgi:outer membrane assembly lipoprotein YfiO
MLAVGGCGGPRVDLPETDPLYDFRAGTLELQREHWVAAQDRLKRFLDLHPGHAKADSAQFLLGRAKQGAKLYPEAAVEFQILAQEYPRSPLRVDAAFEECVSYARQMRSPKLDPTPAYRARTCFQDFLVRSSTSPDSARALEELRRIADFLAEKDFQIGKMYLGMKRPRSARVYLEGLLQNFPESTRISDTWVLIGRVEELEGHAAEAAAAYRRVISTYPGTAAAEEARKLLDRLVSAHPALADTAARSAP